MNNMITILINVLITIESGGNNYAIGDSGNAVGCLQIHPVMVAEVNRLCKSQRFTNNDRYDRAKSKEMARIYFTECAKRLERKGLTPNFERLARMWNGGYSGYKKQSTLKYWRKVERLVPDGI